MADPVVFFTHFSHFIRGQFHLRQEITYIFNFYVIFGTPRQKNAGATRSPALFVSFSFFFFKFCFADDFALRFLSEPVVKHQKTRNQVNRCQGKAGKRHNAHRKTFAFR